MTPHDFEFLRGFLRERSGLVLSDDKGYLVESRLMPVARRHNLSSITQVAGALRTGSPALESDTVEAMTTNESFFFRDKTPFDHFRDGMLPALLAARAAERRLRIWCAAASTGQEPYSLAMVLHEMAPRLAGWRVEILATDLSTEVLKRARAGVYTQFEVQRGLPIGLLMKHFVQRGAEWEIAPELRAMVQFRPLNLLRDFSSLGRFDIVFCRNVLIYFDQDTKARVLDGIARQLAPDGFLALGAAETVVGLSTALRPHPDRRGLYVPAQGAQGVPSATASPAPRFTVAARSAMR